MTYCSNAAATSLTLPTTLVQLWLLSFLRKVGVIHCDPSHSQSHSLGHVPLQGTHLESTGV